MSSDYDLTGPMDNHRFRKRLYVEWVYNKSGKWMEPPRWTEEMDGLDLPTCISTKQIAWRIEWFEEEFTCEYDES